MALFVGTEDGLFVVDSVPFESAERVLDAGRVDTLLAGLGGYYAAVEGDLYGFFGTDWERLAGPGAAVRSVFDHPTDDRLLVGTDEPGLYASTDADAWREVEPFRAFAAGANRPGGVADVVVHPAAENRLVVALENGGVVVGEDGGEQWTDRRYGLPDAVRALALDGADTWYAGTDRGLYRTGDAGRWWIRLDTRGEFAPYGDYRVVNGPGRAGARRRDGAPDGGPAGAVVAVSSTDDVRMEHLPGESLVPTSFSSLQMGTLVAGCVGGDDGPPGCVLERTPVDGWTVAGTLPAGVTGVVELPDWARAGD